MKRSFLTLFAGVGMAIMPLFAQADIVQLSPVPVAQSSVTESPLSCFDFTRTLKSGDTKYDVRALQFALQKEGFTISVSEYGMFGEATLAAVNAFQTKYASDILKNGATPTGAVGRATRAKLNALYGCSAVRAMSQSAGAVSPPTTKIVLVVKSVSLDASGVTATFCNQGSGSLPVFPVRLRLNGIIRDFSVTNAVTAGACETATLPYSTWGLTYDAGTTYAVVSAIDPTGIYKTSQLIFPLVGTTTLAVPAIAGLHLSVRGIQIKSSGLQGTFCNLGDADLTSFPIRITVNGNAKDFDVPGAYTHGKCAAQTWSFDTWGVSNAAGTSINAAVVVDPNNVYKETNEFDNAATIVGSI